jgi:hypothetical protein
VLRMLADFGLTAAVFAGRRIGVVLRAIHLCP